VVELVAWNMYNFLPKQQNNILNMGGMFHPTRSKIIFNKPKEICEVWRAKPLMKFTIYLLELTSQHNKVIDESLFPLNNPNTNSNMGRIHGRPSKVFAYRIKTHNYF
jgi:hypothetical protein